MKINEKPVDKDKDSQPITKEKKPGGKKAKKPKTIAVDKHKDSPSKHKQKGKDKKAKRQESLKDKEKQDKEEKPSQATDGTKSSEDSGEQNSPRPASPGPVINSVFTPIPHAGIGSVLIYFFPLTLLTVG